MHGGRPFGAILVGPDDKVLIEAENDYRSGDRTAHAERVLLSRASTIFQKDFLALCTIYSSAEPCAMCAGAVYWAGVGRVVYALSENDLIDLIGPVNDNDVAVRLGYDLAPSTCWCSCLWLISSLLSLSLRQAAGGF